MTEPSDGSLLPIADGATTWRWLGGELRERKAAVAGILLAGTAGAAPAVAPPYVLGVLVDRVRGGAPESVIVGVAVAIVAAAVLGALATAVTSYLVARLGGQILAVLRERTVARALRLPVPTLEKLGKGELLSRVGADVGEVGKAVSDVIPAVISAVLLGALSLAAMAGLDWRLGLAGAVAVPLYVIALRWYLPRASPRYAVQRQKVAFSSQRLVETMQGARTVRAYRLEERHLAAIDAASADSRDVSVWVFDLFTRFVGRVNRAEWVGLTSLLVAGFFLVKHTPVTVGEAAAAAVLFHRLFNPIGMLLFVFDEVQAAGASLARLVGVVGMPEEPSPAKTAAVPADAGLDLRAVRFSYGDGAEVLHGVDLHVPAGQRVALLGATGAGKSTLAAIAAGSLHPDSGAVLAGGVPLLGLAHPRDQVAIITQETHVFAGPLLQDLLLARPDASTDEISAALDLVGAHQWTKDLPNGLDTIVGEGGHDLTSAQSQQLALARLVLADPPIAILDEATAEAGSLGARTLEDSATAATHGRTTLIVAHRLTQAVTADRIVLLDHGQILEEGTHETLIAAAGQYAHLWSAWTNRTASSEIKLAQPNPTTHDPAVEVPDSEATPSRPPTPTSSPKPTTGLTSSTTKIPAIGNFQNKDTYSLDRYSPVVTGRL
ncbi:ABC transporter ATP-binding protein [Actinocorallia lasiicapitis]